MNNLIRKMRNNLILSPVKTLLFSVSLVIICVPQGLSSAKKCLYVSSYHRAMEWNAIIEKTIIDGLKNECTVKSFFMDTKRRNSEEEKKQAALNAKKTIEDWKPDIVLVSDDNAVKYLLMKYYRDSKIPFGFCGVNWSVKEYQLPYTNATGMIEVNAIRPLAEETVKILPQARSGSCITEGNETGLKVCNRFKRSFRRYKIKINTEMIKDYDVWKKSFIKAQETSDFIILPLIHGINNFDVDDARKFVKEHSKKFSISVYDWMADFAVLSFTNSAAEQGSYLVNIAKTVFAGKDIRTIPIISNRKWDIWINESLVKATNSSMPLYLLQKARKN